MYIHNNSKKTNASKISSRAMSQRTCLRTPASHLKKKWMRSHQPLWRNLRNWSPCCKLRLKSSFLNPKNSSRTMRLFRKEKEIFPQLSVGISKTDWSRSLCAPITKRQLLLRPTRSRPLKHRPCANPKNLRFASQEFRSLDFRKRYANKLHMSWKAKWLVSTAIEYLPKPKPWEATSARSTQERARSISRRWSPGRAERLREPCSRKPNLLCSKLTLSSISRINVESSSYWKIN